MTAGRKTAIPAGLGLMAKGDSLEELTDWLERAKRLGFAEVQIQLAWHPITQAELDAVERTLKTTGLRCRSVGVYNDMLLLDSYHFFDTSGHELTQILEWMPEVGMTGAVVWCGSYNDDLLGDHPKNATQESRALLAKNLAHYRDTLKRHGLRLLFEPWRTHVLRTEQELRQICDSDRETLGVVIDVANLIDPRDWSRRSDRTDSIVGTLLDVCHLVHLKDMKVTGGGEFELPYSGKGEMDFEQVGRLLAPIWRKVPFIIEHVSSDEEVLAAAAFLTEKLAGAGLPMG